MTETASRDPVGPGLDLPVHVRVAVVGAGFSGLGMAVALKQAGIEDFVVLERAGEVGGTWRDNTYPGCQCDVPSNLYSFSFAPNPDWSRTFSRQPEIQDYLISCTERFGLRPHLHFGHDLLEATWDEDESVWQIVTSGGRMTADVVVSGVGGLADPSIPPLPGLADFEGTVFHSAHWDHDHDLTGKRVAVVGTGASAIQFVPEIQPDVAELHVFQRTPPWITPHPDRPVSALERRLFRRLPVAQRAVRAAIYCTRELLVLGLAIERRLMKVPERLALRHLRQQVSNPELRARVTPDYTIGCKRILISNDWYPALQKPNVELVSGGVVEVRPRSVVADDGTEREVDTIIFGTGFHVTDMPVGGRIRGRDGRTLDERWQGSPRAHRGVALAGCPNLFMLLGPNTGLGHTSIVYMIESQIAYVMDCLDTMERCGLRTVEVRPQAEEHYNAEIQRRLERTVWNAGGCASWYLDRTGRNTTLWPSFTFRYRQTTRRFDVDEYNLTRDEPVTAPAIPERVAA